MWVRSLNREDPLEKGIATHSSILGLGNLMDREALAVYTPWVAKESDGTERLSLSLEPLQLNDCHFLLQGIFPTQGLKPHLLHCRQILYH